MAKDKSEDIEEIYEKIVEWCKQSKVPLTETAADAVVYREMDKFMKSMRCA